MKTGIHILLLFLLTISCGPENSTPQALFSCNPPGGNINTLFDLDAGASLDPDGLKNLLSFRWDIGADGKWETDFGPEKIFSCRFSEPGSYEIVLEVKDSYEAVASSKITVLVDSLHHITDPRDGQVYPVVKIGSYWWLGRNLNIGMPLGPSDEMSNNGIIEKYVFPAADPDSLNGGLYTWAEAMGTDTKEGSEGICPPGWHVPSDKNWRDLMAVFSAKAFHFVPSYWISGEKFVPNQQVTHDNYQSEGAVWRLLRETGSSGFDAVWLGYLYPDGIFGSRDYHFPGKTATFWTSTAIGEYAYRVRLYGTDTRQGDVIRFADNRHFAFSVRCVCESL